MSNEQCTGTARSLVDFVEYYDEAHAEVFVSTYVFLTIHLFSIAPTFHGE